MTTRVDPSVGVEVIELLQLSSLAAQTVGQPRQTNRTDSRTAQTNRFAELRNREIGGTEREDELLESL
jgi:hypothetical protein